MKYLKSIQENISDLKSHKPVEDLSDDYKKDIEDYLLDINITSIVIICCKLAIYSDRSSQFEGWTLFLLPDCPPFLVISPTTTVSFRLELLLSRLLLSRRSRHTRS